MEKRNHELVIHASNHLALHAGWWEELTEGDGTCYRMVSPPEQTLFDQVLLYLETIAAQLPTSSLTQSSLSEQVRAILAVCLRWGSYFAVLADEAKPLWPLTNQQSISLIADAEMARINIEMSAALEQWLDILRSDKERYFVLVQAAKQLPLPFKRISVPPRKRERLLEWAFLAECMRSLCSPQEREQLVASRGEAEWVQRIRSTVLASPTRVLANGIINMCWRNGSSVDTTTSSVPKRCLPAIVSPVCCIVFVCLSVCSTFLISEGRSRSGADYRASRVSASILVASCSPTKCLSIS